MACNRKYPDHWTTHLIRIADSRDESGRRYNLELIDSGYGRSDGQIWLFVPGYFQNGFIFDLWPERGISLAKYVADRTGHRIFILHPNGIGRSDYRAKSNLDDQAIDDVGQAVDYLTRTFAQKMWLFGHSNGAIILQAFLGGIHRADHGNQFSLSFALQRQAHVRGLILAAGNVCMTDDHKNGLLKRAARMGMLLRWLLHLVGWINACILTQFISPVRGYLCQWSLAYSRLWSFLYRVDQIDDATKARHYDLTVDGTSARSLVQYIDGIRAGCLQTTAGQAYREALPLITIPVAQVTFGADPMAFPEPTCRDTFQNLGSAQKEFFVIPDQGHEDFMLRSDGHAALDGAIDFVLSKQDA